MPKSKYKILVNQKTCELEISHSLFLSKAKILLDGQELGSFASKKEFKLGKDFALKDNRKLTVRLGQIGLADVPEILIDGSPIEGSAAHPETKINSAYGIVAFLSILNLFVGLMAILTRHESLVRLGFGPYNIVMALFYGVAFYMGRKQKSAGWLISVLVLFALDMCAAFVVQNEVAPSIPPGWIVTRLFFMFFIFQGIRAARSIVNKAEQVPSGSR